MTSPLKAMMIIGLTVCHLICLSVGSADVPSQPNIIFMVADDLGWNDVGFHNPDMKTPNLDQLAYNGIILNQSYVQPICTPSRVAFLTSYYPYRAGFQNDVIGFLAQYGLSLEFQLLPEKLKNLGYGTHMIGKWHLGYCNQSYHPLNRGFDTFFGYLGPGEYYLEHNYNLTKQSNTSIYAYDFWNQTDVSWEYNGIFSSMAYKTQVQHVLETRNTSKPLFLYLPFQLTHSPSIILDDDMFWYTNTTNYYRQVFSSMATQLDTDVGQIVEMLKQYGVYNNSIIVFTADNGGETRDGGNNYPLRGAKFSMYEGGTRASAFIHSPLLKKQGYTYNGMMHAVDWLPTFVGLAGGKIDANCQADGMNMWTAIINNTPSPRTEFIYDLYFRKSNFSGGIRVGDMKLLIGETTLPNTSVPPDQVTGKFFNSPGGEHFIYPYSQQYQLYNITADPTENVNLAESNPDLVQQLIGLIKQYVQKMTVNVVVEGNWTMYNTTGTNLSYLNTNWCQPIESLPLMNITF